MHLIFIYLRPIYISFLVNYLLISFIHLYCLFSYLLKHTFYFRNIRFYLQYILNIFTNLSFVLIWLIRFLFLILWFVLFYHTDVLIDYVIEFINFLKILFVFVFETEQSERAQAVGGGSEGQREREKKTPHRAGSLMQRSILGPQDHDLS